MAVLAFRCAHQQRGGELNHGKSSSSEQCPLREHRTMYFLSRGSSFMLRVWSCVLLLSADSAWFGPGSGLDTELTHGVGGGSLQWFGKSRRQPASEFQSDRLGTMGTLYSGRSLGWRTREGRVKGRGNMELKNVPSYCHGRTCLYVIGGLKRTEDLEGRNLINIYKNMRCEEESCVDPTCPPAGPTLCLG